MPANPDHVTTVGLVGAGSMGSGLGANWIAGGAVVRTCLDGRSHRTRALVEQAGITVVGSLDEVVRCDIVVSVVPPGDALSVAADITAAVKRAGVRPVVADLNAVAPSTLAAIDVTLSGLDLIDGSISGGPPEPDHCTRVYLSGPHTDALSRLPAPWLDVAVLPGGLGAASALKMCTASMYKGSKALQAQAMVTAQRHGVLDEFLDDVSREWPDAPDWARGVALAATKSARFVDEMSEIATTQRAAGASVELFEGMASAYRRLARSPLGHRTPESVDGSDTRAQVLEQLAPGGDLPLAVLFDFSSTLFYVETAEAALLAALGPDFVTHAAELRRWGAINGSSTPDDLPAELADVWERRDLCTDDHRAAYAGLSRHAGLGDEHSHLLYERGISPEAWTPFRETLPLLRRLHELGVPVAVVSNIGWDPRPVLSMHGADRYLDALVLSYEHGVQKPDPAIFRIACAELGVDPADAVMIGDNPHADGGATRLGMRFELVAADPAQRHGDELASAVGTAIRRSGGR